MVVSVRAAAPQPGERSSTHGSAATHSEATFANANSVTTGSQKPSRRHEVAPVESSRGRDSGPDELVQRRTSESTRGLTPELRARVEEIAARRYTAVYVLRRGPAVALGALRLPRRAGVPGAADTLRAMSRIEIRTGFAPDTEVLIVRRHGDWPPARGDRSEVLATVQLD
jgi:hypothetical protein